MLTIDEIEQALHQHRLWVMPGYLSNRKGLTWDRYYQARPNGQTKRWKRDLGRFRIPFKVGFRGCGAIERLEDVGYPWEACDVKISRGDPNQYHSLTEFEIRLREQARG